jgi:hypothetical protein
MIHSQNLSSKLAGRQTLHGCCDSKTLGRGDTDPKGFSAVN